MRIYKLYGFFEKIVLCQRKLSIYPVAAYLSLSIGIMHTSFVFAQETQQNKPYVYPNIDYTALQNPELVKRGEYLAKMGDCIACHTTPDGKEPFAGGLPVDTPFGTIYSTNI